MEFKGVIEKVKDFQELIASRFNNVIVGSVVLSSMMMNARGILIFIYSDKDARLSILRNWELNVFYDLIIPIILSSFYIVIIPWISAIIKKKITNKIYKQEQDAERDKILISLNGMQDVAVATVKSTSEYAEKLANDEIQRWLTEREQTCSELQAIKSENILLKSKNEELAKSESNLSTSLSYYSMLYERCTNSINQIGKSILKINYDVQNKNFNNNSSRYKDEINEQKHNIIKQMTSALIQAFEANNIRPASTLGDWEPPIPTALTEALESMLAKLDDEKAKNDLSMQRLWEDARQNSTK